MHLIQKLRTFLTDIYYLVAPMLSTSNTRSHPTRSAPCDLAQEIIDNITDELSSDKATLEQCSIVSRSFYVSSRRHLFTSIEIDTPQKVVLLHRLLIRTPDIAFLVHELRVGISLSSWCARVFQPTGAGVDIVAQSSEWLRINTVLANVIAALPQIKRFRWHKYVDWNALSSELQSALAKLFQNLIDISIRHFNGLPLHIVPLAKRIWFSYVGLENSGQRQVTLPHLELLKIRDNLQSGGVQLLAPNLQRLILDHKLGVMPSSFLQQVINSSGRSLLRLLLFSHSVSLNDVDLSKLCCLQFLGVGFHTLDQWKNIASLLKDTPLMQTLKYLYIHSSVSSVHPSEWQDLAMVWKDLDLVLSSAFALRQVHISPFSRTELVRGSMPLLEGRGILTFEQEDFDDIYPKQDRLADFEF